MMFGGKEALSDGMGAAAKWFHNKKIPIAQAGGADPQMQCLFSYATGSFGGGYGAKDPGNTFGDYFDTVIEYPMITNPCSRPQCSGKMSPMLLLRQMYGAPGMRGGFPGMGGFGGMGGMGTMGAMGRRMPGMGGMQNMGMMGRMQGRSPMMSAMMPKPKPAATLNSPTNTAAMNPASNLVKPAMGQAAGGGGGGGAGTAQGAQAAPAAMPAPQHTGTGMPSVQQLFKMFSSPVFQQTFMNFMKSSANQPMGAAQQPVMPAASPTPMSAQTQQPVMAAAGAQPAMAQAQQAPMQLPTMQQMPQAMPAFGGMNSMMMGK